MTQSGKCSRDSGTPSRSAIVKTVTSSPLTSLSPRRKCRNAATTPRQAASVRFPSCERTCTSARIENTERPAIRHSDSVSKAPERRIVFSKRRARRTSVSDGGPLKAGDAIGESDVVIVNRPSKGRSGKGATTSAVMLVRTLLHN